MSGIFISHLIYSIQFEKDDDDVVIVTGFLLSIASITTFVIFGQKIPITVFDILMETVKWFH